ncbi:MULTISPECIES: hypothetical protein [unclassified Cryobacterium]|uniref:hypothetical protein n=1 Tax=unclassified Cryobacterium TaxID=2649013 RepID=UPI002AB4CC1C|nr:MULTISPECIES: hypothetical protein [unclassified Cryobacterium]MDY7542650.1 hypothetical protein [Cryobacterium sp. 5B3]MEB0264771.1 hypothetical protein [Cryobacterium sp. 10I5]MEB0273743.1 hypothetical protein [Cryobacterium sp. 5B3]
MSTAARKARKRAGIKFEKAAKVGTPFKERAWYALPILDIKSAGGWRNRSAKKLQAALDARGIA